MAFPPRRLAVTVQVLLVVGMMNQEVQIVMGRAGTVPGHPYNHLQHGIPRGFLFVECPVPRARTIFARTGSYLTHLSHQQHQLIIQLFSTKEQVPRPPHRKRNHDWCTGT
jgi:hypothetical protein